MLAYIGINNRYNWAERREMGFDPDIHHRRSIRLRHWDYASAGAYFVTICVADRACVFGTVEDGQMRPNELGDLVAEYWRGLPRHFPTIGLNAFVVMPNHVHFIVWLNPPDDFVGVQSVGAQLNCAPTHCAPTGGAQLGCAPTDCAPTGAAASPIGKSFRVDKQRPTLGQVVRAFKAATARRIHQSGHGDGFAWQATTTSTSSVTTRN
ncbi:MAG: transposase [Anaerolineales bacterium]